MSGICERGFMLMLKKFGILGALSELLEPHLFGRTGALKFGTIGVHQFLVGRQLPTMAAAFFVLSSIYTRTIKTQPF